MKVFFAKSDINHPEAMIHSRINEHSARQCLDLNKGGVPGQRRRGQSSLLPPFRAIHIHMATAHKLLSPTCLPCLLPHLMYAYSYSACSYPVPILYLSGGPANPAEPASDKLDRYRVGHPHSCLIDLSDSRDSGPQFNRFSLLDLRPLFGRIVLFCFSLQVYRHDR